MTKKKRIFFETEEVIRKTKRGYIDLDTDYFQFYSTAFYHLASLTSVCAKDFVLWIMSKVDDNNEFIYNTKLFNEFITDLSNIQQPKSYTQTTVYGALKELSEKGIIIRYERGHYRVNPKLFWSDDTSKRITAIKHLESNNRIEPQLTQGNPINDEATIIEPIILTGTTE